MVDARIPTLHPFPDRYTVYVRFLRCTVLALAGTFAIRVGGGRVLPLLGRHLVPGIRVEV
jgi:hypothetical protein